MYPEPQTHRGYFLLIRDHVTALIFHRPPTPPPHTPAAEPGYLIAFCLNPFRSFNPTEEQALLLECFSVPELRDGSVVIVTSALERSVQKILIPCCTRDLTPLKERRRMDGFSRSTDRSGDTGGVCIHAHIQAHIQALNGCSWNVQRILFNLL